VTGPQDPTREQPAVEPTVSTAPSPARPHRWWSAIPRHLGRARTSTVVIGLLFVAIFALYLNVKPEAERTGSTGGGSDVTEPANTTGDTVPTQAPEPTTTPAPTTVELPTTTEETTSTTAPEGSSAPLETTESVPPPTTGTTTVPPLPTTPEPTG
jgi:hypothetical protein